VTSNEAPVLALAVPAGGAVVFTPPRWPLVGGAEHAPESVRLGLGWAGESTVRAARAVSEQWMAGRIQVGERAESQRQVVPERWA